MFEAVEKMFAANTSTRSTPTPEDTRRLSPGPEDGGHWAKKQMSTHPGADDGTRSASSSVGSVQVWCALPTASGDKEVKEGARTVEDLRPRRAITIGGAATVADAARAMACSKEDVRGRLAPRPYSSSSSLLCPADVRTNPPRGRRFWSCPRRTG